MRAIIFDAFGTLFRVTSGGSAKTIMKNITDCGIVVDEKGISRGMEILLQKSHVRRL